MSLDIQIILVRHPETSWNKEARVQGKSDTPWNKIGKKQSLACAKYLKKNYTWDKLWTSPLQRCLAMSQKIDKNAIIKKDLQEINFGSWEGKLWHDLYQEDKKGIEDFFKAKKNFQAPQGESLKDLILRIDNFLKTEIFSLSQKKKTTHLIVSHGAVLRTMIILILDLPLSYLASFSFANGSLSLLSIQNGKKNIEFLNQTLHLRRI